MLTDKELDEIEARLATFTAYSGWQPPGLKLLADAVTLLAEVRRTRPCPRSRYYGIGVGTKAAP